jgi:hypothetical protein
MSNAFWRTVMQSAAMHGSQQVMDYFLKNAPEHIQNTLLPLALVVACAFCRYCVASAILPYIKEEMLPNIIDSIYWAARHGNEEVAICLLDKLRCIHDQSHVVILALLGAASSNKLHWAESSIIQKVFPALDTSKSLSEAADILLDSCNSIIVDVPDSTMDEADHRPGVGVPATWPYQTPPEVENLSRVAASGDLNLVRVLLTKYLRSHSKENLRMFGVALQETITNHQPAILAYLLLITGVPLHTLSPEVVRTCRSVTIMQILVDAGLDINEPLSRCEPPLLGYVLTSSA